MTLDMPTVSLVTFSATTVLGLVLCFVWWRERSSALIGWWGLAQLVMASGMGLAATAVAIKHPSLSIFGQSLMVMSAAILWMAVRQFEGRDFNPLWVARLAVRRRSRSRHRPRRHVRSTADPRAAR